MISILILVIKFFVIYLALPIAAVMFILASELVSERLNRFFREALVVLIAIVSITSILGSPHDFLMKDVNKATKAFEVHVQKREEKKNPTVVDKDKTYRNPELDKKRDPEPSQGTENVKKEVIKKLDIFTYMAEMERKNGFVPSRDYSNTVVPTVNNSSSNGGDNIKEEAYIYIPLQEKKEVEEAVVEEKNDEQDGHIDDIQEKVYITETGDK